MYCPTPADSVLLTVVALLPKESVKLSLARYAWADRLPTAKFTARTESAASRVSGLVFMSHCFGVFPVPSNRKPCGDLKNCNSLDPSHIFFGAMSKIRFFPIAGAAGAAGDSDILMSSSQTAVAGNLRETEGCFPGGWTSPTRCTPASPSARPGSPHKPHHGRSKRRGIRCQSRYLTKQFVLPQSFKSLTGPNGHLPSGRFEMLPIQGRLCFRREDPGLRLLRKLAQGCWMQPRWACHS